MGESIHQQHTYRKAFSMTSPTNNQPVFELRVALTTTDFDRSIKFYSEGLGIKPSQFWDESQGRAVVLDMSRATLEIFDEQQAQTVDQIEAGQRISGQIRFAIQVPDLKIAMQRLLDHGAILIHPPVLTPWGDNNVRLQDPDGLQVTLFQKPEERESKQITK